MSIFLLWSAAIILIPSDAANHYCVDQNTVRFSMRSDTDQPERLLTNIRNRDRYAASQLCRWELVVRDLTEPRYLMLQRVTAKSAKNLPSVGRNANNSVSCDSKLSVELQGSKLHQIWHKAQSLPTFSTIVPYKSSSQKLVTRFTTGDPEPSADCPRVELNIMLVKKGFCGRNMLLHRSHCHLISHREIGMADLRETGLRLASFSSMDDVRHLIRDNDLRMHHDGNQPPLDLSSPVRVGVFRCPGSLQAFYWNFSNGSCMAQPFDSKVVAAYCNLTDLHCASIRVDKAGKFYMEFADCHLPMRTLFSFTETPSTHDFIHEDIWTNCRLTDHFAYNENYSSEKLLVMAILMMVVLMSPLGIYFGMLLSKIQKCLRNVPPTYTYPFEFEDFAKRTFNWKATSVEQMP